MVDVKKVYFHSLKMGSERSLNIFEKILSDRKILSLERSNFSFCDLRMNKSDEICLSKKAGFSYFYNSAFDMYVRRNVSFIVKGNLPNIYKPKLIPVKDTFGNNLKYVDSGWTDLYDEYRIKDEISLDDVVGINYPVKALLSNFGYQSFFGKECVDEKRVISFYEEMVDVMEKLDITLPVYDICFGMEISDSKVIEKVMKKN